jgi:hypothetical protein
MFGFNAYDPEAYRTVARRWLAKGRATSCNDAIAGSKCGQHWRPSSSFEKVA